MTRYSGAEDEVRVTNFFGGSDNQSPSQNFSGGRVLTVIGGCELDLRRASIADEGAVINIVASLGGVRLMVPDDWAVNVQTRAFFGGRRIQARCSRLARGDTDIDGAEFVWWRGG